jgi:hypothetical protein
MSEKPDHTRDPRLTKERVRPSIERQETLLNCEN